MENDDGLVLCGLFLFFYVIEGLLLVDGLNIDIYIESSFE